MHKSYFADRLSGYRFCPEHVFFISLVFSLLAVLTHPYLNPDGMLYIDDARNLMEGGIGADIYYQWPFFSFLIAGFGLVTGLGAKWSAYVLSALFLAGTCYYLVRICQRLGVGTLFWISLVVLALPAINDYRADVVREFGCWFFLFGALNALLCWRERRDWRFGTLFQIGIGFSALFRPEVVFVPVAVFAGLPFLVGRWPGARDFAQLFSVLAAGALGAGVVVLVSGTSAPEQIADFLGDLNLAAVYETFSRKAEWFGDRIVRDYSREDSAVLLFVGLLTLIPIKVVGVAGIFVFAFGYFFRPDGRLSGRMRQCRPFPLLALCYGGVLAIFVFSNYFLATRYAALLVLLCTPLIVEGTRALYERTDSRVLRSIAVFAITVTLLRGVVTTSPGKHHLKEAGAWIEARATGAGEVYFDDPKVAFYAGAGYGRWEQPRPWEQVLEAGSEGYRFFVLEMDAKARFREVRRMMKQHSLSRTAVFEGPYDQAIWILER